MGKFDFKKEYKDLYLPKDKPSVIEVPSMNFIFVEGKGNPNEVGGEYHKAVELLYSLTYTIKMSKMGNTVPEGYFEYVVPPLEGLWWFENDEMHFTTKEKFEWISMLRQPDFVTKETFDWACGEVQRKKNIDTSKAKFGSYNEGLCVQIMHHGSFDDEPKTIALLESFIKDNDLINAISTKNNEGQIKRHHEIYLSDPRKTEAQKRKTVIRIPVSKK